MIRAVLITVALWAVAVPAIWGLFAQAARLDRADERRRGR